MRSLFFAASFLFFSSCHMQKQNTLYEGKQFTLGSDRVLQGNNTAIALSSRQIRSNYKSPASTTFSRLVKFKFSINEKDNEMAPGNDHWVVLNGESQSPVVRFGELPATAPSAPATYLPVNYVYTFLVDMSPVLQQFEEKGYYEAYDGSRIAKTDFKGFYIAGAAEPLSWDFVNLGNKGLKLQPTGKGNLYSIKLVFNPYQSGGNQEREWVLKTDVSQKPSYQSDQPLVDALFNLSLEEALKNIEADSTFRTGSQWGGVWTRDISYSIFLAFAYHQPDIAKISLLKKVKRKRIVQDTGSGGAWPVSSDRTIWALAAWELYKTTGDKDWLQLVYEILKNTLDDDALVLRDPVTGMYKGESSFLDWREQTYPRWMNNADIYNSLNLGTNVVHYQAHMLLAAMARELQLPDALYLERAAAIRKGINKHLWMNDRGFYGQYLYGRTYSLLSPRFETLGEALAILFDVADEQQAVSIMEKAPLTEFGMSCIFPQIPGIPPYHNNAIWPFVQAYWNLAAAKTGHEAVLQHGLASIYRAAGFFLTNYENMVAETGDFKGTEVNSDRMLWSMAGNLAMVHRVFMGMQFEANGIRFAPAVPSVYTGTKTLSNFKYRNAVLHITVRGTGNNIQSVQLDGAPLKEAFLPATISGKHSLVIELDNKPFAHQHTQVTANRFSLPEPRVKRNGGRLEWTAISNAVAYVVYRNGETVATVTDTNYPVDDSRFSEYQIAARDQDGTLSFACEPVAVYPETALYQIELESFGGKSMLPFVNYSGAGFTEISTIQNTTLGFELDVPEAGMYRIDFRYSNGSGPWNTDNKCAQRSLYMDSNYIGVIVLPQRGTDEWSDWGYTNSYTVALKKGSNRLYLKLEPWNTNMNGDVNRAMLDVVRVIKQ